MGKDCAAPGLTDEARRDCRHCSYGYLGHGDLECINGILIDVDVFHDGWQRDVLYPPAPCHPRFCAPCAGSGVIDGGDCPDCRGTGYTGGGPSDCQERLQAWADMGREEDPAG